MTSDRQWMTLERQWIVSGAIETTGALLIRNSRGPTWGTNGYGCFPYDYVLRGLAADWWSLLKGEWIDTGAFKA